MDNLNTEIPYMITRFIWTTLIQKLIRGLDGQP